MRRVLALSRRGLLLAHARSRFSTFQKTNNIKNLGLSQEKKNLLKEVASKTSSWFTQAFLPRFLGTFVVPPPTHPPPHPGPGPFRLSLFSQGWIFARLAPHQESRIRRTRRRRKKVCTREVLQNA